MATEAKTPKRRCSLVKLDLPPEAAEQIQAASSRIPAGLLRGEGIEPTPHVTVLFGLTTQDPDRVASVLAGFGPVPLWVRGTWRVISPRWATHDCLCLRVESERLRQMRELLWLEFETIREELSFSPHVTVARVARGRTFEACRGIEPPGFMCRIERATFSDRFHHKTQITLA